MSVTSSPLINAPEHVLKRKNHGLDSHQSVESFQKTLEDGPLMGKVFELNKNTPVTREQAMSSAKDMMEAFYTQTFKALFEEIHEDRDDDESGFATDMTQDIFVEQLAETMGRNVNRTHEKIADLLMKQSGNNALDADAQDLFQEKNTHTHNIHPLLWEDAYNTQKKGEFLKNATPWEDVNVVA